MCVCVTFVHAAHRVTSIAQAWVRWSNALAVEDECVVLWIVCRHLPHIGQRIDGAAALQHTSGRVDIEGSAVENSACLAVHSRGRSEQHKQNQLRRGSNHCIGRRRNTTTAQVCTTKLAQECAVFPPSGGWGLVIAGVRQSRRGCEFVTPRCAERRLREWCDESGNDRLTRRTHIIVIAKLP